MPPIWVIELQKIKDGFLIGRSRKNSSHLRPGGTHQQRHACSGGEGEI